MYVYVYIYMFPKHLFVEEANVGLCGPVPHLCCQPAGHPRSVGGQSPKTISCNLGGINAKSGFKLPER